LSCQILPRESSSRIQASEAYLATIPFQSIMPVISYLPSAVSETGQDNCIQQLDDQIHNLRTSRVTPLITWKMEPGHPPLVVKHCPKCEQRRHFYCSESFRVNAQQKDLDIWLIYKCQNCDATWKCTVLRHVSPTSIKRDLFDAFQHNDRLTSWKYAFDFPLLKRNGAEIDSAIEYTVSGPELSSMSNLPSEVQILLTFDFDGKWGTDAVIALRTIPVAWPGVKRSWISSVHLSIQCGIVLSVDKIVIIIL
jgi:hypothetical protein